MHELSLCQGIVRIIETQAKQHGFSTVKKVRLDIGALACVEQDALSFGFVAATKGTVAEGAELAFIVSPGHAWCPTCSQRVEVKTRLDSCSKCGAWLMPLPGGDEIKVKDLEVD